MRAAWAGERERTLRQLTRYLHGKSPNGSNAARMFLKANPTAAEKEMVSFLRKNWVAKYSKRVEEAAKKVFQGRNHVLQIQKLEEALAEEKRETESLRKRVEFLEHQLRGNEVLEQQELPTEKGETKAGLR